MNTRRTALITGANSGLGKATAVGLARLGYRVLMVARSAERGEASRLEIVAVSGSDAVDLVIADLASQASIRALADTVLTRCDRLDLLINNVGNSFMTRHLSPDGIELSLAVNHLAAFLLTNLLLDRLKASAPARIVNVGTRVDTSMDCDDLQWERRRYQGLAAYAQSKLGVLHFTFELDRRLAGSGVTVNCVHPGVFRSNLGRNAGPTPRWLDVMTSVFQPFLASAETAARRVLYLATAPEVDGISGRYFGDRVELRAPSQTLDPEIRARVWAISARLTGLETGAV